MTLLKKYRIKHMFMAGSLLLSIILAAALFQGCASKDELYNLSKCEFRLLNVSEVKLAGIAIDGVDDVNELSTAELGMLLLAILSDALPLSMNVNLEVRNPNKDVAALDKAEWELFIDDKYITKGIYEERIEIPPDNGTATMRVPVDANIAELVKGESNEALLNLALNLANAGSEASNITLKAKPYIRVGNRLIAYPGFFDIKTTYTSGD